MSVSRQDGFRIADFSPPNTSLELSHYLSLRLNSEMETAWSFKGAGMIKQNIERGETEYGLFLRNLVIHNTTRNVQSDIITS